MLYLDVSIVRHIEHAPPCKQPFLILATITWFCFLWIPPQEKFHWRLCLWLGSIYNQHTRIAFSSNQQYCFTISKSPNLSLFLILQSSFRTKHKFNMIISPKKLIKMAETGWNELEKNPNATSNCQSKCWPMQQPYLWLIYKGHFVVYTIDLRCFVLPLIYI